MVPPAYPPLLQSKHLHPPKSGQQHLSLSRLDHWPPGTQTHPEIMQCTADFHHQITDAPLPQPNPIFDDATALDATIDMLNSKTAVMQ
jgi:hypothetical protein